MTLAVEGPVKPRIMQFNYFLIINIYVITLCFCIYLCRLNGNMQHNSAILKPVLEISHFGVHKNYRFYLYLDISIEKKHCVHQIRFLLWSLSICLSCSHPCILHL